MRLVGLDATTNYRDCVVKEILEILPENEMGRSIALVHVKRHKRRGLNVTGRDRECCRSSLAIRHEPSRRNGAHDTTNNGLWQ